ncbi:cytochrome c oxidase subunit II [Vicingaceae bacterium]|nr:cytochrome c oxidase subunit II [Vicingaceae bacterium]
MKFFWSLLFLSVPVLGTGLYVWAAYGWAPLESGWLPEDISQAGATIDHLFMLIHYISAVIFIGTGVVLAWSMWRYSGDRDGKASYVHSNTRLEVVWSIIPGIILIFLSLYQMQSWADNKINRPQIIVNNEKVNKPPMAIVKAKQFGWEIYYAGPDGLVDTADDLYVENELVVPMNDDVVLQLESRDVIHSFCIPELRLKQDIVPGMKQFCWFRAINADPTKTYELICTELCGFGHYKMKGKVRFLPAAELSAWLVEQREIVLNQK